MCDLNYKLLDEVAAIFRSEMEWKLNACSIKRPSLETSRALEELGLLIQLQIMSLLLLSSTPQLIHTSCRYINRALDLNLPLFTFTANFHPPVFKQGDLKGT
jgi:hypothetical protein